MFLILCFLKKGTVESGESSVANAAAGGESRMSNDAPLVNVAVSLALTADYEDSTSTSHDDASLTDAAINLAERSPRFEDPSGHANVTVQLGGTAFLNCRVLDLQDKTVCSATLYVAHLSPCCYKLYWICQSLATCLNVAKADAYI